MRTTSSIRMVGLAGGTATSSWRDTTVLLTSLAIHWLQERRAAGARCRQSGAASRAPGAGATLHALAARAAAYLNLRAGEYGACDRYSNPGYYSTQNSCRSARSWSRCAPSTTASSICAARSACGRRAAAATRRASPCARRRTTGTRRWLEARQTFSIS